MGSLAWPIEEVLFRPLVTLLLAALVPLASAQALRVLLLPRAIPESSVEAARVLAPFRRAAMLVGVTQLCVAWWLGWTALGPALVADPAGEASHAFAWLAVVVALLSGGVGRLVERPGSTFADARSAMAVRLRLLPLALGPALGARALDALPLVDRSGGTPVVALGWALLGLVIVALSVAYGGLALALLTGALRPAPPPLAEAIARAASREGVKLWLALRLPTGRSHFANAAALPWARTIFVTDRLAGAFSPAALDAVLAHEAAHLSEGPRVGALRLSAAVALLGGVGIGARVGSEIPGGALVVYASIAAAILLFVAARRVARRMEERADAQARAHVGGPALAEALLALQRENLAPLTTGSTRRVHPDLYDRITACGHDLGPRPEPPATRLGLLAGLAVASVLFACAYGARTLTVIEADHIATIDGEAALRRQRVDPWDANAMLALAWDSRRDDALDEADARIAAAEALGAPRPELLEARAEVAAARGRCDEADALFDEAIAARSMDAFSADPFAPLELGGWHLPPSLVSECRRSVEDVAPGPDPFELLELDDE